MPHEIERILVLVRAIPEESKKYGYTVCVAGLNENNEWRRLYPFKFRYENRSLDFRKKDMIEVETIPSENDKRKESRKVTRHRNLFSPMDDDVRKRLDI